MMKVVVVMIIGCLSRSTGSENFAFFGQWFCPIFSGNSSLQEQRHSITIQIR